MNGIGIDVGKEELVFCVRSSNGLTESPLSFSNSRIGQNRILRYLQEHNISADVPILLESTGPYHWHTARFLSEHNYLVKVANPLHTRQIARHSIRKRKTDKVDAGQLAFLAAQGYGYVFKETFEQAQNKALVRHYWQLKSALTSQKMHENYLQEFRALRGYSVTSDMQKLCDKIKAGILKRYAKGNDLRYLDSVPGLSPILAATILAELEPLDRFARLEQIIAFAGLDPAVRQSGKKNQYGRLSKRGSPTLRRALFLASMGSFWHPPFSRLYQRHKDRGLHHTVILCIIARKILRIAMTLLRKRREFNESYLDGS